MLERCLQESNSKSRIERVSNCEPTAPSSFRSICYFFVMNFFGHEITNKCELVCCARDVCTIDARKRAIRSSSTRFVDSSNFCIFGIFVLLFIRFSDVKSRNVCTNRIRCVARTSLSRRNSFRLFCKTTNVRESKYFEFDIIASKITTRRSRSSASRTSTHRNRTSETRFPYFYEIV